jgi:SAM-dependent methyltransferase
MTQSSPYTFGDSDLAALRLRLLAEAYEAQSRAFLGRFCEQPPHSAIDLGCGPGYSTRLVQEVTRATSVTGIDASEDHLRRARAEAPPGIAYVQHDLRVTPFPIQGAEFVFERFLLTHFAEPQKALQSWAGLLRVGGKLLVQETSRLESDDPDLSRYYELVGALQRHYGQALDIGRELGVLAANGEFEVLHFEERVVFQPAAVMARLHALNIVTWSRDPAAALLFDARELQELKGRLDEIASGRPCAPVRAGLGELVAVRAQPQK